jgi:hypothetical protein
MLTDAHGEIIATLFVAPGAAPDGGPVDVQFVPLEGQQAHRVGATTPLKTAEPGSAQHVQLQYDLHDRQQLKVIDEVPQLVERLDSPGGAR